MKTLDDLIEERQKLEDRITKLNRKIDGWIDNKQSFALNSGNGCFIKLRRLY